MAMSSLPNFPLKIWGISHRRKLAPAQQKSAQVETPYNSDIEDTTSKYCVSEVVGWRLCSRFNDFRLLLMN